MAANENFEDLLGRLRRQVVMSPPHGDPPATPLGQQQQHQQNQQSSHQSHLPQQQHSPHSTRSGIFPPPPFHLGTIPAPPTTSHHFSRNNLSEPISSPGLNQSQPAFPPPYQPEAPPPQPPQQQPPSQQQSQQPPTSQPAAETANNNNNNSSGSQIFSQNTPPPYANPMSPSVDGVNASRTASLLQLLKFSQAAPAAPISEISQPVASPSPRPSVSSPPPVPPQAQQQQSQPSHNRGVSASDLVASLFGRQSEAPGSSGLRQENIAIPAEMPTEPSIGKGPSDHQDLVLQLLGQPKPSQDDLPSTGPTTAPRSNPSVPERHMSQGPNEFGSQKQSAIPPEPRPMSVPPAAPSKSPPPSHGVSMPFSSPTPSKGLFTYVNPFEQLHATSPRNRTPRSSTTPVSANNGKSGLGTREVKAEHVPLPYSSTSSFAQSENSPASATIEAEAAKSASTLDQALKNEEEMEDGLNSAAVENAAKASEQREMTESPVRQQGNETPDAANGASTQETFGDEDYENIPPARGHHEEEEDDNYQSASEAQGSPVLVYNFPMKPFSSITINPSTAPRPKFPISKISDIARMPRLFDQLDRNLIAASHQFIVYAISKSHGRGGIRVLRQFDGKDKVLMKDSTDRTFNVTISNGDRVLGTGISGAVVWAELGDFDGPDWNNMFVFPPSEEQGQSNGVLKSRARKTCRQADVFAIGRGKTISIIHAPTAKAYAQGRKNNEVASKKYLAEHTRTIDTGKASKDFTFSDDDSVIISIDKAGKLKLWDVQELINFSGNDAYNSLQPAPTPQPPMVLTNPVLMFSAVAAGESYRATSVMFLDKFRPYHKCLALRYVIVGMKQNHTLQLWDLALGRPVQEINFPQESDTDALCSVVYHPTTGIIVVGNPTRNSIYFIHLSAPKYNLPPMSQAQYIQGLAVKDSSIPKPDATAILSGLREYSFASKGQLMSLDILDSDAQGDLPPLFELYVAHSKGMTALNVFKEDLGWDGKNSAQNPVDAVKEGICTLAAMSPPPLPEKDRDSDNSNRSEKSAKSEKGVEKVEKPKAPEKVKSPGEVESAEMADKVTDLQSGATQGLKSAPPENAPKGPAKSRSVSPGARAPEQGEEKPAVPNGNTKRKRKEKGSAQQSAPSGPSDEKSDKAVLAPVKPRGALAPIQGGDHETIAGISPAFLDREIKKFEKSVSSEFAKTLNKEIADLYRRIDEDKRIQQAAGDAKQDAILRLLSSTLTENVEQVIGRIVMTNIQQSVLPAISDVTSAVIERKLGESVSRSLTATLPAELHAIVPEALKKIFNQPEFMARIGEAISRPLAHSMEQEISRTMHNSLIPTFKQLSHETATKLVAESDRKHNETIQALERMHIQDTQKIDQLTNTVKGLVDVVQAMAKSQAEFQDSVQRAQAEYVQAYEQTGEVETAPRAPTPPPPPTPEQLEAEETEEFLRNGRYEEGTIKWLQSKERQAELFDEVVVRYRYDFLPNLSQLVLLSVSAAVSIKFDNKVYERLSWLEGVLAVLDPMDPEIHEICHRIMAVVVQRLEQLYMSTAEKNMADPILRKIPAIARRARELSSMAA
ncbi:hypothetical protein L873DRAFT_842284 [Choiromyces venosus 120613-1]|uniref:EDC4-like protein pdc1 beta-propeller domain-containing protein n=1 Tax=Choiromyces venosus 120613-1 TaxID=1336337 RepID=A0A3N4K240_9PEZI|nr:hypothetical protein L873DRAFT_842284 [Choiromyces venosus 120613-1]